MKIKIKYFAALREQAACSEEDYLCDSDKPTGDVEYKPTARDIFYEVKKKNLWQRELP